MRYADEMRGSEGEPCLHSHRLAHRHGTYNGTVQKWDDATKKADVLYTDGTLVRVSYSFVTLAGGERV